MTSDKDLGVTGHAQSPAAKRKARHRERLSAAGLVRVELFIHQSKMAKLLALKEALAMPDEIVTSTPVCVTGHACQSTDNPINQVLPTVAELYHEFLDHDWRFFMSIGGVVGAAGWLGVGLAMLTS